MIKFVLPPTSQLDHKYLQNTKRHCQSQYGIANYGHSHTSEPNSMHYGPQTAKNRTGVLTYPTGSHQAAHCHASSYYYLCHLLVSGEGIVSLGIHLSRCVCERERPQMAAAVHSCRHNWPIGMPACLCDRWSNG